jgi:hypothetical protein
MVLEAFYGGCGMKFADRAAAGRQLATKLAAVQRQGAGGLGAAARRRC